MVGQSVEHGADGPLEEQQKTVGLVDLPASVTLQQVTRQPIVTAEELGELDTAIVLRVSVTAREGQPRSAFDVNVGALVDEIEKRADVEIDQLWIGDTPYVQAVVIRPTGGGSIPDGKYEGQVTVSDAESGEMCPMREPYKIEIGS